MNQYSSVCFAEISFHEVTAQTCLISFFSIKFKPDLLPLLVSRCLYNSLDREVKWSCVFQIPYVIPVLHRQPWMSLWSRNARFRRGIPDSDLAQAITPPREIPGSGQVGDGALPGQPDISSVPDIEMPRVGELDASAVKPSDSLLHLPHLSPVPPSTEGRATGGPKASPLLTIVFCC